MSASEHFSRQSCRWVFVSSVFCQWHCVLFSEGNGNYRTAGSDVLHQLPKEVPQHHLWTPSHWSAAKCKPHNTTASSRVGATVLFSTFIRSKLGNSLCSQSRRTFQTCCVSSSLLQQMMVTVRHERNVQTGPGIFCGSHCGDPLFGWIRHRKT